MLPTQGKCLFMGRDELSQILLSIGDFRSLCFQIVIAYEVVLVERKQF